jgi:hypothetical protein|tara:strand:- start:424 stop:675 length:252 start_codon:yes stop_codon:yes gene_type:complete
MKRSFTITVTIETIHPSSHGQDIWALPQNKELLSLTPEQVESELSHRLHYLGKDLISKSDVTLTRVAVDKTTPMEAYRLSHSD